MVCGLSFVVLPGQLSASYFNRFFWINWPHKLTIVSSVTRFIAFIFCIGLIACGDNGSGVAPDRIDRNPTHLIYSKHARCRMDCRHIDESEVQEILKEGRINDRKSEPAGRPDPKYALEGTTHDGQQVRIVFAMAQRGTIVVTVIDLDTDWSCSCR